MRKSTETGAQALVRSLEKAGVEVVFGYPGGNALDLFDAIRTARFRFVLGRHEQGCVHMADGYARALGRPGVALVTSGPGATNTITALAAANMDGVPLVVISGQVPLSQIGTDAFQEADMTGICRAVTKHSFLVKSADEIPETVAEAFYIATHGKPGAVVIDVPQNVQRELTAATYPERVCLRAYHPESAATPRELNRLAQLLNGARRPLIYAGGGVISAGASKDVAALAHKAQIPVVTTLMGLGAFDGRDRLSLGMAGLHGTVAANRAIDAADVILALGVRFSDRITGSVDRLPDYARRAKIVQVDCDPSSIDKNVRVALGIVADIKDLLTTVGSRVRPAEHADWLRETDGWKKRFPVAWKPMHRGVIMPQQVVESVDRATGGRAVLVTDVGQHQMWCARHFTHALPRHFLTSGGMGAMGFGIPAAIGAAIARPDRTIVAVVGDGGAQMTFGELAVAAEQDVPLAVVVVNNGCLGMVRQQQERFFGGRYSGVMLRDAKGRYRPDFVKLAKAYGIPAARVSDPSRLDAAVRRAVRAKRPTLLEVMVEPFANVSGKVL